MLNKNIRFPLPRRIISRKEQNAPRFTTKKPTDAQQKHPIPSSPKNHFPKGAKRSPIYHQKANRCSTKTSDSLFPEESFPERSKTRPDLPPKSQQMLNKNIRFPLPRRIISRKEQNAPRFTTKKP